MTFPFLNLNMLFNGVKTYGNYNPFGCCSTGSFCNSIFPFCNTGYNTSSNYAYKNPTFGNMLFSSLGFGVLGVGLYSGFNWINNKINERQAKLYNNANLSNNIATINTKIKNNTNIIDAYNNAKDVIAENSKAHIAYTNYIEAQASVTQINQNIEFLEEYVKLFPEGSDETSQLSNGNVKYDNNEKKYCLDAAGEITDLKGLKKALNDQKLLLIKKKHVMQDNEAGYNEYIKAQDYVNDNKTAIAKAEEENVALGAEKKELEDEQKNIKTRENAAFLDKADGNKMNRTELEINNNNNIECNGVIVDSNAFEDMSPIDKKHYLRGLIDLFGRASDEQKEAICTEYEEKFNIAGSNIKKNDVFNQALRIMKEECGALE